MNKKFFGSESSLQRQFIASGLAGVFAPGVVGGSCTTVAMEEDKKVSGNEDKEGEINSSNLVQTEALLNKSKVVRDFAVVLLIAFNVLLFTIILPALNSEKTNTQKQKEQGSG